MVSSDIVQMIVRGMIIGVALAAPVGPILVEMIRRAVRDGFLHGWLIGIGALTCDSIFSALVVSGMTPIADNPTMRVILFFAGGLMLGFVGWNSIRQALGDDKVDGDAPPRPRSRSFATGFLMAALNPMGIVYWLSVGSALVADAVDRVGKAGGPLLVFGVMFGIFLWVTFVAGLAQISRRFVTGAAMRWITGGSGVLIAGFGVWFLWRAVQTLAA